MGHRSVAEKMQTLEELLVSWGSVAVGYSGGVDSTFLAAVCARVMPESAVLMRLDTPFAGTPERVSVAQAMGVSTGPATGELDTQATGAPKVQTAGAAGAPKAQIVGAAKAPAKGAARASRTVEAHVADASSRAPGAAPHGAPQASDTGDDDAAAQVFGLPLITLPIDPYAHDDIVRNDENRCYYCKLAGFTTLVQAACERGIAVVVDGSNADDAGDYRPGMRALEELGVRSPLMETGWHKDEEREMLRAWGIPVWNMPVGACLATRIPCGEPLTPEKLAVVRACEDYLHELGLCQVRARLIAGRVQVEAAPDDLCLLEKMAQEKMEGPAVEERPVNSPASAPAPSDGVLLPTHIATELETRAGGPIDSWARPYSKGNMNG